MADIRRVEAGASIYFNDIGIEEDVVKDLRLLHKVRINRFY